MTADRKPQPGVAWCHQCDAETMWESVGSTERHVQCVGCQDYYPCRHECTHLDCADARPLPDEIPLRKRFAYPGMVVDQLDRLPSDWFRIPSQVVAWLRHGTLACAQVTRCGRKRLVEVEMCDRLTPLVLDALRQLPAGQYLVHWQPVDEHTFNAYGGQGRSWPRPRPHSGGSL